MTEGNEWQYWTPGDMDEIIPGYRARIAALEAERDRLTAERDEWQRHQSYRYIGRDGKAVLARDIEDRAEAAEAENARLRDALSNIAVMGFSSDDAVARRIGELAVEQARAALKAGK